ncbi:hypothetical protein ABK988_22505 [Vibrio parahaemolyticus]|nr:hypothetical protein [Vibrio parahaemolyticus]
MPGKNERIRQLEQELLAYSETHSRSSNSKKIRALFDTIQYVIEDGLSLDHVVSFLNQNDISVSKNTLKVYLYRIRKKRDNNSTTKIPSPEITLTKSEPVISPSSHKNTPSEQSEKQLENTFDQILEKYHQCDNRIDKYVALGGRREDIEDKSITTQKNMVMTLRNKLRQKYKGIY